MKFRRGIPETDITQIVRLILAGTWFYIPHYERPISPHFMQNMTLHTLVRLAARGLVTAIPIEEESDERTETEETGNPDGISGGPATG